MTHRIWNLTFANATTNASTALATRPPINFCWLLIGELQPRISHSCTACDQCQILCSATRLSQADAPELLPLQTCSSLKNACENPISNGVPLLNPRSKYPPTVVTDLPKASQTTKLTLAGSGSGALFDCQQY